MAATLTVIWWRDIPAQVIAREGRNTHKIELHRRFQVAIDRAAAKAGKNETGAYLAEWRREHRPCGPDLEAEATAEAGRLEEGHPRKLLEQLVAAGGVGAAGGIARGDGTAAHTQAPEAS